MKISALVSRLVPTLCVGMLISGYAYAEDKRSVTVKQKRDLSVEAKKGLDPALLNAKYYAIVIGNNDYKHLPKLKTAVNDAKDVERVLKTQYGFETKLLLDATRKDILSAMNDFKKKAWRERQSSDLLCRAWDIREVGGQGILASY